MRTISRNYKLAAKLTFVNALVSFISFFMDDQIPKTTLGFSVFITVIFISIITGILMLKGIVWVKYAVLIVSVIGFLGIFINPSYYFSEKNPMLSLMYLFSTVLQIYTLFLLFKKSGKSDKNLIK
ncbi:MAG: hypothetical protein ACOH1X_06445 [Kaistella sp.]